MHSLDRWIARVSSFLRSDIEDVVLVHELGPERTRIHTALELVEADRERVRQLCEACRLPAERRIKMASYLDHHYHGLIAMLDGKPVGHVWWVDRALPHPHVARFGIELGEGDAYAFDLYLAPEHRGGGASSDLFVRLRELLTAKGYRRVYGSVRASNLPAVWLHKLQHYRPVKTVPARIYLDDAVLVSGGSLYLRNPLAFGKQRFDYRRIARWS